MRRLSLIVEALPAQIDGWLLTTAKEEGVLEWWNPYTFPRRKLSEKRRALAPDIENAFLAFSQKVFADGALLAKTK